MMQCKNSVHMHCHCMYYMPMCHTCLCYSASLRLATTQAHPHHVQDC